MVGEGVLMECLAEPSVSEVLMLNRRPYPATHPKLKELILTDFMDLARYSEQLRGYDACFYCAGVGSRGMTEAEYSHITYDTTLSVAHTLVRLNKSMVFCHVSGAMTDGSEKGRIMWARVKGKAENALLKVGFREVYNFRPGFMKPTPGQRNVKSYYGLIAWLYPILRVLLPNQVSTLQGVARAMINSVRQGYPKSVLEIRDINALAKA